MPMRPPCSLTHIWAALFLLLAGCAERGPFPSLAQREVERENRFDEPVRTPPAAAPDPALAAAVSELLGQARQGQSAFGELLPAARASAAAAGAAGTESWIEAEQALSRLEAARAPTVIALAELDRLSIKRAGRPTESGQFQALMAAVATAKRLADAQQEQIDRLRGSLDTP